MISDWNNNSFTSIWTTSASSDIYVRAAEFGFQQEEAKPKEQTPERWLRSRVKEICDIGKTLE